MIGPGDDQALKQQPVGTINVETHDLAEVRMIVRALIKGMNAGPKSRARALAITKLQEAEFWAGEALFAE